MHFKSVLYVLGNLLVLLGCTMVLPLIVALACDSQLPLERYEILGFFVAIGLAVIVGLAFRSLFETNLTHLGNREGAAIVTLTWALFSLIGCLPLVITGSASFTDAYFETMSGFTTTGASVLAKMEVLPHGLMLWRCQTQWMGGMGIVVLSVAIFPMLGIGGYRMFKAEVPGGSTFERNAPRIKDTAKVLWIMYLTMTIAETGLLMWGGMTLYDAVCHAFTTMSTGGFSTATASVAAWPTPMIQWVIIVFMFLAGINFSIFQQIFAGSPLKALKNTELHIYTALTVLLIAVSCEVLSQHHNVKGSTEYLIRAASFQVVSIGTTTGYATENFDLWPNILRLLLLLLMFIGGCTGSTGGGMKVARLIIFIKAMIVELKRSINPREVLVVRVGERALDRDIVSNIMNFLVMYVGLFTLATITLTLLGMDLISATSATAANIGNIGPGLGSVGPMANYSEVATFGKWVLIICQLLGRLELYSVLVLLLKRTWIR